MAVEVHVAVAAAPAVGVVPLLERARLRSPLGLQLRREGAWNKYPQWGAAAAGLEIQSVMHVGERVVHARLSGLPNPEPFAAVKLSFSRCVSVRVAHMWAHVRHEIRARAWSWSRIDALAIARAVGCAQSHPQLREGT